MTQVERQSDFYSLIAAGQRSAEISEADDVYGWLCGDWDLECLRYLGIDVSGRGLRGEVHAARVLEGRAVQDVWIMPRSGERKSDSERTMNMYGTTLRWWDPTTRAWRIAWTNPVSGHREEQLAHRSGADIVQEGARLDGTRTRWTFTEITRDSFHWKGEALSPGKDTWTLEGEFLATRRRAWAR